VVDAETTGLDPARHGIIEIGAVDLRTGIDYAVDCRVSPFCDIEDEALAVNGASRERCFDPELMTELEALQTLVAWIHLLPEMGPNGVALLAGMNPRYDLQMMLAAVGRSDSELVLPFGHRTIDMHTLAVGYALRKGFWIPARGFNTDAIYVMLGMPLEPKPHRAITGAQMEAEAMRKLLDIPMQEPAARLPYLAPGAGTVAGEEAFQC
jgi:DNA polymerase III epsilon subunit-like protein